MENKDLNPQDRPMESPLRGLRDEEASELNANGYALYYPLVSEWEHPDGLRFDQPRD